MEHVKFSWCSIIFLHLHTRIIENDRTRHFFEIQYGDAMTSDKKQLVTSV